MMDALRSLSRSWVGIALLGLLIAGLLVFGVGQSGQVGANAVVTAGQSQVSMVEYRLAYERQINALSQQFGTRLSREQARQFGLESQVLSQIVTGAVLDEQARVMGLGLSEGRQAQLIGDLYPEFYRADGRFDRDQLRFVLSQQRITEAQFLDSINNAARRQQIIEAVSDGVAVPAFFLDQQQRHQGQTRDLELIEIGEDAVGEIAAPSDAALTSYFDANRDRYRAPEYRTVKILELTPALLANADTIDEATVRAEYEARIDRFRQAEQRTVRQLVFSDREAALAARERVIAGESIDTIVGEMGRTMADVTIGTFTQAGFPDQSLAEAAFTLAEVNQISDVVDRAFGPTIVWVTEILPEQTQPFEDVRDELAAALAQAEANDILLSVSDAYEDARASGATMEEAAAAQQLTLVTIDAVDATGRDKDGAPVDLPASNELLREIFTADIDVENPPLAATPDGFIWYELADIEDERARTLDEVRDIVTEDWIADERSTALDALAQQLVAQLGGGASGSTLAEENSYTLTNKFGLTRNTNDPDLGRGGVADIFAVGPDAIGFAPAASSNSRFVYRLTAVTDPLDVDPDGNLSDLVAQSLANDLLQQTINQLQDEFPVSVNQRAIDLSLGQ